MSYSWCCSSTLFFTISCVDFHIHWLNLVLKKKKNNGRKKMKASGWVLHSQHESTTTLPCFICCSLNKWFDKIRRSYSLGKEWSFVIMSFFLLCCLPFMLPKNWCFFWLPFLMIHYVLISIAFRGGFVYTCGPYSMCILGLLARTQYNLFCILGSFC
jgi:hypothetical protein